MAGFLNALSFMAPLGQTLGPAMQQGTQEAERQKQLKAESGGLEELLASRSDDPAANAMAHALKLGASPDWVASTLGGKLGTQYQAQAQTQRKQAEMNRIMSMTKPDESDPTGQKQRPLTTSERVDEMGRSGLFDKPEDWAAATAKLTPKPTAENFPPAYNYVLAKHGLTREGFMALPDTDPTKQRVESEIDAFDQSRRKAAGMTTNDLFSSGQVRDPGFEAYVNKNPAVGFLPLEKSYPMYNASRKATSPEITSLEQAAEAESGFDELLRTGKSVLPATYGGIIGGGLAKGGQRLKAWAGDPVMTAFEGAKAVLIPHLRSITGGSRVNQQELEKASAALENATNYPALQAAVAQARLRVRAIQKDINQRLATGALPMTKDEKDGGGGEPDYESIMGDY